MAPAPQRVLDAFIVGFAAIFSAVSLVYIVITWRARQNFFVALRSPLLTCVNGVCIVSRYMSAVCAVVFGGLTLATDIDLITLPVIWVAKIMIVFMSARIFVMYNPTHRPKYGFFLNDTMMVRSLVWLYLLIETILWLLVTTIGKPTVSSAVSSFSVLPPLLTAVASICILYHLRNVHDLINLSRNVRAVATVLLVTLPLKLAAKWFMQPHSLQQKYTLVAYFTVAYTPIVCILNIRPVYNILHDATPNRNNNRLRLPPCMQYARIGVTPVEDTLSTTNSQRSFFKMRNFCVTRLAVIMNIDALRAAFGDFCHRSLCGESFQFVVDVADFKKSVSVEAEIDATHFKGFGSFIAIVNDYIRHGSHSEVNIDSKTRQAILQWCVFDAYSILSVDERMHIFSCAEKQVLAILADNLLNKFVLSEQYKQSANLL